MRGEIGRWRALANALAVLAILAVAGLAAGRVGARHWQWQETFRARAEFESVGGLEVGGKVRVQGIDAGVVEAIVAPKAPGLPVTLVLRVDARLRPLVRSDATATIAAQGVVGAKVVEITPGRADAPLLADGGTINTEAPIEMADLLRDASKSLRKLDAVAEDAHRGLGEINALAAGIRQGKGTLGRLVQDEEAYQKLVGLSKRGERTLDDLDENLAALKRTWPLSRYFNDRGFNDRDRVLFQPGSERQGRTLAESDLFEPGRSVLTAKGRARLDEVFSWFKATHRPRSEVVIAAFTDDDRGDDLAQILTQEQADAVRNYLVKRHAIDAKGWFGTRKVAAVGFGTQAPRMQADAPRDAPARRVEIILFTPQA